MLTGRLHGFPKHKTSIKYLRHPGSIAVCAIRLSLSIGMTGMSGLWVASVDLDLGGAIGTIDTAGVFGECVLTPYRRYVSGVCTRSAKSGAESRKQAIEFFTIPRYLPVQSDARSLRANSTANFPLRFYQKPRSTHPDLPPGVYPLESFPHADAALTKASRNLQRPQGQPR